MRQLKLFSRIEHSHEMKLTSKWGECILLVIYMMCSMEIFVQRFYVMQLSMHPVDTKFYYYQINCNIEKVGKPSDIAYSWETFCPSIFNHILRKWWKSTVPWHSFHCNSNLQEHSSIWWDRICNHNVHEDEILAFFSIPTSDESNWSKDINLPLSKHTIKWSHIHWELMA